MLRVVSAATLVIFFLAQPGTLCLPLCLSGAHSPIIAPAAHQQPQAQPCHSGKLIVVQSELPAFQSLSTMLPTRWAPLVPSIRVVALEIASPKGFHLRGLPPNDPPPPRFV
jgi:hypothetical protein